jgi:alpha-beta hydrolase superfamily lysophospholipase
VEERTIQDAHGVDLLTRWWTVDAPSGLVLVAHGASEHSGRYDRFARALNDAGFAVVAVDHRGHGATGKSTGAGMMGPGGGSAVVDDLHEVRAAAALQVGAEVPVHLFGHSMGSLIGLAYLTRYSDGLRSGILCGFPADIHGTEELAALVKSAADAGMRDEPFDALSAFNDPFTPARTPFDWLSRDDAEVDRYIADPYCGDDNPLTFGFVAELFDIVAPAAEQFSAISCPVLVIAGDQDSSGAMGENPTKLADALRAAGRTVELKLYEGARHELLNETNRDEVTADVVAWLQRTTSG